eukprot:Skav205954  [mRNA]  locus=scaffold442:130926:131651:+ [translate_table: standard]
MAWLFGRPPLSPRTKLAASQLANMVPEHQGTYDVLSREDEVVNAQITAEITKNPAKILAYVQEKQGQKYLVGKAKRASAARCLKVMHNVEEAVQGLRDQEGWECTRRGFEEDDISEKERFWDWQKGRLLAGYVERNELQAGQQLYTLDVRVIQISYVLREDADDHFGFAIQIAACIVAGILFRSSALRRCHFFDALFGATSNTCSSGTDRLRALDHGSSLRKRVFATALHILRLKHQELIG